MPLPCKVLEQLERWNHTLLIRIIWKYCITFSSFSFETVTYMMFQTGMSLLDQASWSGLEDVVRFLLANGVDPNNSTHDCGYKSLMFAAIAGHQGFCVFSFCNINSKSNFQF